MPPYTHTLFDACNSKDWFDILFVIKVHIYAINNYIYPFYFPFPHKHVIKNLIKMFFQKVFSPQYYISTLYSERLFLYIRRISELHTVFFCNRAYLFLITLLSRAEVPNPPALHSLNCCTQIRILSVLNSIWN